MGASPSPASSSTGKVNSMMELNGGTLRRVLADNREPLIAKNMLDKGHGHQAAENEIDVLMKIVDVIKDVKVQVSSDEKALRLSVEVGLDAPK